MANPTLPPTANARDRLLDAAEEVALVSGASGFTLEAVAAQASVSKGGLLYHFPSKDALISGLVSRMVERFQLRVEVAYAQDPEQGSPGQFTRAVVTAMLEGMDGTDVKVGGSVLASLASQLDLLAPLRESYAGCMARIQEDRLPPGVALVVVAALDGLMLWKLFRLWRPAREQLSEMQNFLKMLSHKSAV